ncbi:MAG TPA: hypothetical protein VHX66_17530 [Solirubrobacteraceae bacterium]|nr:hypothetical protein [Solirubrobacteraceae bacterium]
MSRKILEQLRDATAFKPKPPDYELAIAHVPTGDVGIPQSIDERVLNAITTDDEAFVIIVGPPGSGKSSVLTAAARNAASPEEPPHPLPLTVPVAHHDGNLTAELLVKAIAQGLATEPRGSLQPDEIQRLEEALATTITTSHQPTSVSGSITAGLPFLNATVGAGLGKDLVTLTTNAEWQGGGPGPSLLALRDLASAHGARLVVIFHDTDVWSVADRDMAARARSFFSALRVLLDCPEITFLVAVQTHWTETGANAAGHTAAARQEYQELAARVGAVLKIPRPRSQPQALDLMTAIINRRVQITLDDDPPGGGWTTALFTPAALELLAHRCRNRNIRQAIADIRDAFDHLTDMPDRIDREHLLDVIDS